MPVVVTGSAGFLGRAVVAELLSAGVDVVGIDRRPDLRRDGFTPITTDLVAMSEPARAALAGATGVVHLAGCSGVRDAAADIEQRRDRDNVRATAHVLAAVPGRTPVVVTSSSSVYGGSRSGRPSRESDALRPRGGYARSKVAVERLCARRADAGGRVTVVRPFTVAGEGQRPDMAIARWLAAAREGKPLTLFGSPGRTRDITDVEQCAAALRLLLAVAPPGAVNIGTGRAHTLAEIATAVVDTVRRPVPIAVQPAAEVEVSDTLADPFRLTSLTGLRLATDLPALVARQAAASQDRLVGATG